MTRVWSVLADLFSDERGRVSAARVFFGIWTAIVVWAAWHEAADAFWPVASAVLIGLLSWAAGARIAQYIAPQIGSAASATAFAIREKVKARRNVEHGYEESNP